MSAALPVTWSGFFDDAAIFPPGDAALPDAIEAFKARRVEWYGDLVASLVVTDEQVPAVGSPEIPLSIVITRGAGGIAGALKLAAKAGNPVAGVEIALRDLDDLAGNARRVVAAVDAARHDGALDDKTQVFVELPASEVTHGWEAAADAVAAAEFRLKFRTGGMEAHQFPEPTTVAGWILAALDRETPFKCTAGLHRAVRHEDDDANWHHGFLNILVATRAAWDGADARTVTQVLRELDASILAADAGPEAATARRWFTSVGSCSILEPLADLTDLGLLTQPTI